MADYATLLRDHTTLKVRSIDRIFLQAYVPKLQTVGQLCIFLRWHRNVHIPSSAAFGQIGDRFIKEIERFSREQGIPIIHFEKGENKEQRARVDRQSRGADLHQRRRRSGAHLLDWCQPRSSLSRNLTGTATRLVAVVCRRRPDRQP